MQQKPSDLFGVRLARQNYFIDMSNMATLVKAKKVFIIYAWQLNPNKSEKGPSYCYIPWIHCNGTNFSAIDINKVTHFKNSLDPTRIMYPMNKFFKNIDELAEWMGDYYNMVLADII